MWKYAPFPAIGLASNKKALLSVRTELEDAEDVVGEDAAVEVVHGQSESAACLVVGGVHHQELQIFEEKFLKKSSKKIVARRFARY